MSDASVWVYSHSSDPADETFLRVWGSNGRALPKDIGSAEDYSFGYLRFHVARITAIQPKEVDLIVYNKVPLDFTKGTSIINPLELHLLDKPFHPKTWEFQQSVTIAPDHAILGIGKLVGPIQTIDQLKVQGIEIKIPLAKFKILMASANKKHVVYLALASAIDAAAMRNGNGSGGFYKFYSSAVPQKELRPRIVVKS